MSHGSLSPLTLQYELSKGMLGDFIRLTDYVAVEALVNLTVRTSEVFLAELLKPRKAGLLETTVLFTDEGTAFSPTCDDIKVRSPCQVNVSYGTNSKFDLPISRRFGA